MRRSSQERSQAIRAGGKALFIAREMAAFGILPFAGAFIFYVLKMVWNGRADFTSIPYGENAFLMCAFAVWGYFRAERDWRLSEEESGS